MSIVETGDGDGRKYAELCTPDKNDLLLAHDEVTLTADFERLLSKIIKKRGFIDPTIERRAISNRGGNYLGVLYEVNVRDGRPDGPEELNLFVKCVIPDDKMTILSIGEAYAKEMYAYDELAKIYEDLQAAADVPQAERYRFVRCHGVIDARGAEAIVLENMSKRGFKTCDRMECMSLKFAELAVAELAKFHALSYVTERKNSVYFEKKLRPMKTTFRFNAEWRDWVRSLTPNTLEAFECEVTKLKISKFIGKMLERMPTLFEADERPVLCHGDYRVNNILMREEEDGEIAEVIPVDYQLIHAGDPINDFVYLVFGGSDRAFRRQHLARLKRLYRRSMGRFLRYFDLDLEALYPAHAFERDYARRLDYGLMVGINFLPIILAPEGDAPDFGETDLSTMKLESSDAFRERIRGLVQDFVDWGYL